jgi:hypothetical protein
LNAICAVYVPDDFVLLVDIGLHNAGWAFARTNTLELHEVVGSSAKFCWAGDLGMVEVVSPSANPNHQQLAERIHTDEKDRADGEQLVQLLNDLFELVGYKLYSELDLLMRSLDVSRTAPEYLVGILRATSKDTRHLPYWTIFLAAVKGELSGRGLDAAKILVGLV